MCDEHSSIVGYRASDIETAGAKLLVQMPVAHNELAPVP
jgi:hypothetical protein